MWIPTNLKGNLKKTSLPLGLLLTASLLTSQTLANETSESSSHPFCELAELTEKECNSYQSFQHNADIIRLEHLQKWVTLIENHKEQTGKYPFQGESDIPIVVEVATPIQQQYVSPSPQRVEGRTTAELFARLAEANGAKVAEWYDPQYAPDVKPNFYIYMIDGDDYFFAVHTHQPYAFARQVAPDYHKVEVSNRYHPSTPYILTPKMMFESSEFKQAISKPIELREFFTHREDLTRYLTQEPADSVATE